jgi:cyanophycinase-like exopeptidase
MTAPRLLAIIGSGETAPTMTSVHAELFQRAGPAGEKAVMLDTPFGFQENADELAARTVAYFRDSVGRRIEVASFRDALTATPLEYEQMCAAIAQAGWVFAGPGSPTYAIRQWNGTRVPDLLASKLATGGVVVFSSAAAVGLGEVALPVYEIYKVGAPLEWTAGLDLVRRAGIRAAVIPHYNNAEGGTHDTRFCYMGERRLRVLEAMLPDGCGILGIDEHTACIIDVDAASLTVRGRGRVTWRSHGAETHWRAPDVVALADLTSSAHAAPQHDDLSAPLDDEIGGSGEGDTIGSTTPFMEEVSDQRDTALRALAARDPNGAAEAMLAMETTLHEWSSDPLQSDEPDRARASLRELVVRLAELARTGSTDPRERVAPLVDAVLGLRDRARSAGRFADADALRDALVTSGVAVHDTPEGSTWELT